MDCETMMQNDISIKDIFTLRGYGITVLDLQG